MSKPRPPHWFPVEWEKFDVAAIQAVARGTADERQQQHALKFIVEKVCGVYDETYVPDNTLGSVFLQGRRNVGLQIVKFTVIDLSRVQDKEPQSPPPVRKNRTLKD